MVTYLNVGPQIRTYSDYLRATQEVEKKDSMELSRGLRTQATNNPPKPWATSFFPLQKLKGNQPIPKASAVHLGEEDARSNEDEDNNDPSGIEGVYGALDKGCK